MVAKALFVATCLGSASLILVFSILSSSPAYASTLHFKQNSQKQKNSTKLITPGNPMWPIVAMGDRLRIAAAPDSVTRSRILLNLSSDRLTIAKELFKCGNDRTAFNTLEKSHQYLQQAFETVQSINKVGGKDSRQLLSDIETAVIGEEKTIEMLLPSVSEQMQPILIEFMHSPQELHGLVRDSLMGEGITPKLSHI